MNFDTFTQNLTARGYITAETLNEITKKTADGVPFWDAVCDFEDAAPAVQTALRELCGIETYRAGEDETPEQEILSLVTAEFAYKHNLIPVSKKNNVLSAALADPFCTAALEELELICPFRIKVLYIPWQDMRIMQDTYYGKDRRGGMTNIFLKEDAARYASGAAFTDDTAVTNAPPVRILDSILDMAIVKQASDIHIEPMKDDVRIRFRVDGRLLEYERISKEMQDTIISRLKVMGRMDIAEKRLPQDGRFIQNKKDMKIDFRLSTVPALYGEKAVIRILYGKPAFMEKTELGFSKDALVVLNKLFKSAHGAILLTGPTGSGKSTTMAAFLRELNTGDNNITTIEDPVENVIEGVNHININPKAGFDFPRALRSILRQDPDIIMVGEIREPDTAKLAINSALTGHLVLSTLHTNDAVSAIYRLIDMNVADYLVYAAVRGVVSQRLVRRLCPLCKKETAVSAADSLVYKLPEGGRVYNAAGCHACGNTGYAGRFAIYEILIVDDALLRMFAQRKTYEEIKAALRDTGMKTLWDCGRDAVVNGRTSFAELTRAVIE